MMPKVVPAVVDLPTPPLPEATAMICFIPGNGRFCGSPLCALGIVGALSFRSTLAAIRGFPGRP